MNTFIAFSILGVVLFIVGVSLLVMNRIEQHRNHHTH